MRLLKAAALAAMGMIALAGCQKQAGNTPADEAAVRAAAPAFAVAYNAGEADKLAGMYWEDAVLQPPGVPAASGRAAIRDFFAADTAATKSAGAKLVIEEGSTVAVSGSLAYEAGAYSVVDASGKALDKGKFLGVLQKRDGKWLYVRDTWNSDMPPAPAAAPVPASAPAG